MEESLAGRWAVVTGASKGIGFAIAEALVAAEANLVLSARGVEALTEAERALSAACSPGEEVLSHQVHISDEGSVASLFAYFQERLPRLDVFVANAGGGSIVPFVEITRRQWDSAIGLNVTGTFMCVQAAARMMKEGDGAGGSVVVVSSIRGMGVRPGTAAYATSKAAVNQMVRVAAYELAPEGIRVNTLSPGITATPLTEAHPDVFARMVQTVPGGRAGTPADMAAAALFLAGPDAKFIPGANLVVDGGENLW